MSTVEEMRRGSGLMMSPRKGDNFSHPVTFLIGIKNSEGNLENCLGLFRTHDLDIAQFESRPNQGHDSEADFMVVISTSITRNMIGVRAKILSDLEKIAVTVTVLDDDPDTTDPNWFPRRIEDLDHFASRVLNLGDTLESDHPGAKDPVYLARRKYFADLAINYKHHEPIPNVDYTDAEKATWKQVYTKLSALYPTHACDEFNTALPLLERNCGYSADNIPQLRDISGFLRRCTGFRLRPVAGLLSSRDFLAGLAFRVFHSTQYIRHGDKPLYTPEPDVCHELLGHVPLFANKEFAEFSQEIGLASLGASDADIERLATCYWFSIEFGLCRQHNGIRAYGAGLLSSFGELQYSLSDEPEIKEFDPNVTGVQKYPVTTFQPTYFVAQSFDDAKDKMRQFAAKLKRPFQTRYNPYTQSIELLETSHNLKELARSIQSDVMILNMALSR
eukprot:m.53683 g.53683  ORF g.53683 m.53683 type:complete len:446 (+) comp21801_c0_seq2:149-1486(+)